MSVNVFFSKMINFTCFYCYLDVTLKFCMPVVGICSFISWASPRGRGTRLPGSKSGVDVSHKSRFSNNIFLKAYHFLDFQYFQYKNTEIPGEIRVWGSVVLAHLNPSPWSKLRSDALALYNICSYLLISLKFRML